MPTVYTFGYAKTIYLGGIAQLVENLLCKKGVIGTNTLTSTSK